MQKIYRRILVVLPNWVGDVVLATPTLAAMRTHFKQAHISYLMRPYVREIVEGCGWHDIGIFWPPKNSGLRGLARLSALWGRLRMERFDLAILLTNSFRSALSVFLARVPKRLGYARDGRGWMLTDRLRAPRQDGRFLPRSVLHYYADLAERLDCPVEGRRLHLKATEEQQRQGRKLLEHYQLDNGRRYAVINTGAAFGAAKCWLPERFAELCDRLRTELEITPVLVGAPGEVPLMRDIAVRTRHGAVCMDDPGTTLGSLKHVIARAALLVCNDTGPRHYGIAFDVPTVTIFGPTDQAWTATDYPREICLQAAVECGPCQLPRCPIDLRCMHRISTELVLEAARRALETRQNPE